MTYSEDPWDPKWDYKLSSTREVVEVFKIVGSAVRRIDHKHHIEGEQIIKTSNGQVIPEDEPTILFRGRDDLALPLLRHYKDLCILIGCTQYQLASMDEMIEKFQNFKLEYPERMKQPGITKGK